MTVTKFLEFVNKTGSPYHAVLSVRGILDARGFKRLRENEQWKCQPGGKYYVTRNHSCIAAFAVGDKCTTTRSSGFVIAAGHSDSPCLRVRPSSHISSEGYLLLGVETYGGGLWHTWFDRGLGVAGKVVVKTATGALEDKLVRIADPICVIPNLAIHLTPLSDKASFDPNTENNLRPIMCTTTRQSLEDPTGKCNDCRLAAPLLQRVAAELDVDVNSIADVDLCLFDSTPSRLCGIHQEFVESPRLDNLVSVWAAFEAIVDFDSANSADVAVAVAFDHEEIGSMSWTGANSNTLRSWLSLVDESLFTTARDFTSVMHQSFFLSCDQAHGVHPNYSDKHQAQHRPMLNKGIVIKENSNQRYATSAMTMAMLRHLANKAQVPVQDFVVRNDSPCGSTIGPMSSAHLGVRTIDIGAPQWAMHSCREIGGTEDILSLKVLIGACYDHYRDVDAGYVEV